MNYQVENRLAKWLSCNVSTDRLKALEWNGVRDLVIDKLKKDGYNPAECDVDGIIVTACKMYALLIPGYNVLIPSEYDSYITKEVTTLREEDRDMVRALQRCGRSYEEAVKEALASSRKRHDILKEFTVPDSKGTPVKVYVRYPTKPPKYLSYGYLKKVAAADGRRNAKIASVLNS